MMTRRRVLFVLLVIATIIGMLWLMTQALSPGGIGWLDSAILIAFALVLPWIAVGFWNASIGWLIQTFSLDPIGAVHIGAVRPLPHEPITVSTALLLCIRNEMPARLVRNLESLIKGLVANQTNGQFHVYVLSDTTDERIAEQEAMAFEQVAATWQDRVSLTYRRREVNTGYKAGNIADFCARWGAQHEFALVLDADSLMSATAVERLVRVMQVNPRLGILQGLVVGLPSGSAFTRLFQFGMRLGMRSYTLGSAWWQGDCGPYWGHNAVIRLAPFIADCELPVLQGRDGQAVHILSHDQVEAVLMRRAGYEVRVYPLEDESYEENPPTLIDFIGRDLRWCAGNMQYLSLLSLPGLKFTSRVQLCLAILMFTGAPAWALLMGAFVALVSLSPAIDAVIDPFYGIGLLVSVLLMSLLPKIVSAVHVLSVAQSRRSFGGTVRFVVGFFVEMIFSFLITPILWVSQTIFLTGLLFGKRMTWAPQNRDSHSVSWRDAARMFGLHTVIGLLLAWPLVLTHPSFLWIAAIYIGGLWVSIPLTVISARPELGAWMRAARWLSIPEEITPPKFLQDMDAEVTQPAEMVADLDVFDSGRQA
jgi:membrane glycosyltransferase